MGGIIWLASFPKSGNTWTRAFLHEYIRGDEKEMYDINEMNVLSTSDNSPVWYEEVLKKPVMDCTHEEIAKARPLVHQFIHDKTDGFIFLKTHNAFVVNQGIPLHTPALTAGGVYIVRNPLDVVTSYADHMGLTVDEAIDTMGEAGTSTRTTDKAVFQIMGSWSEHVYSWTKRANPSLFFMRYEDMLTQPKPLFADLVKFLHLSLEPERLRKAIERTSFKNLQKMEEEKGFKERSKNSERFFREGKAGQWKFELTRNQIKRIVRDHGEQMDRFGYLKDAELFLRNPAAMRQAQAG